MMTAVVNGVWADWYSHIRWIRPATQDEIIQFTVDRMKARKE